jgi:hypothetical protein
MDEVIAFGTAVVISPVEGAQELVKLSQGFLGIVEVERALLGSCLARVQPLTE